MINYEYFYSILDSLPEMKPWLEVLPAKVENYWAHFVNPLTKYKEVLAQLPQISPSFIELKDKVRIGLEQDIPKETIALLQQQLKKLHPWRKGPYDLFGIYIDTEWRSDWKWDRVKDSIASLEYRTVLDVGCGNGYHCWRMLGAGAKFVVGIDPIIGYLAQYAAVLQYIKNDSVQIIPGKMEDIPLGLQIFDTVFSMGVLYHRRSPIDHLTELKLCLRSEGEMILETLVVDGPLGHALLPEKRYARMNNVWFIPSVLTLESWLKRMGFKNIRLLDVNKTSIQEQRSTEWMSFESLVHCLDENNTDYTVEGLPAPKRAIFIANAP